MSRSYKKSCVFTDGKNGQKKAKRKANRAVRNNIEDIPTRARKAYKKYSCSWDIHDYVSRWSEKDAWIFWKTGWKDKYPSYEDFFNKEYAKWYIRK